MKTSILMIPASALSAIGFNSKSSLTVPVSVLSEKVTNIQMQNDALMASMKKMTQEMKAQPMKGNVGLDFASMLKIHHQGAIDMSKIELQQGKDATMKKMAQEIIDKQTKEVEQLNQLISSLQNSPKNYNPANKQTGPAKAMNDNMMSMKKMGSMSMGSVDHEYADMMAKHHKDGITMAKSIITYSKTTQLKSMAQKSIPEQTKDIEDLQQWMQSHK